MELEWDEAKRQRTLRTRGLDFEDLVRFEWRTAIIVFQDRDGEFRKLAYGHLDGRLMAVGYVIRDGAVRVFSMRKANKREQKRYAAKTSV
ncbi:MAG: BrnT family toxin [Pseudomonadota bacterium]